MKKKYTHKKAFVISVGGSLIATPAGLDVEFLKNFRAFIIKKIKAGARFYLVVGGGVSARNYITAAAETINISKSERDWLGITATRLNAKLLQTILGSVCHEEIISDPSKKIKSAKKVVVAGGYKPGWSTDYVSVLIAKNNGVKSVINLSNIDYVYDKDPRQFSDAKKLETISWAEFRKMIGNRWNPGMNAPFDPIASKEADKSGIDVVVMNGANIKNIDDFLSEGKFKGTVIS